MATHSSVLAWRIPGTGEPGELLSMGSHRVGHDWSDLAAAAAVALCERNLLNFKPRNAFFMDHHCYLMDMIWKLWSRHAYITYMLLSSTISCKLLLLLDFNISKDVYSISENHFRNYVCSIPLSMGFSRLEYESGLPFPPPEDLSNPVIKPVSPVLAGGFFTTEPPAGA